MKLHTEFLVSYNGHETLVLDGRLKKRPRRYRLVRLEGRAPGTKPVPVRMCGGRSTIQIVVGTR